MKIVEQAKARVPIDSIEPHPRNPRRGNEDAIAQSIEQNGFFGAVIVQKPTNLILAGSHRWRAAKRLGAQWIDAILVDVDELTARRIMLVDNRSNDLAGYRDDMLLAVLEEISKSQGGLSGTGYDEEAMRGVMRRLDVADAGAKRQEKKKSVVEIVVGRHQIKLETGRFQAWERNLKREVGDDEALIARAIRQRLKMTA